MRGSTRKRGNTWTAYWFVTDADGERRQRSKGGFARRSDAQAFLNETISSVNAGIYVEPSAEPLAMFLRSWLRAIASNVKP